jgi:hypothetical protein
MIRVSRKRETGSANSWVITTIGLIVFSTAMTALAVWLFVNYTDQKTNVDTKIDTAVATAKKTQADADESKFAKREKEPNYEFVGPDDYGRVTFSYPKTWSVYVAKDVTDGGTYEAYLNPGTVPPVGSSQQFALRIVIEQESYDSAISGYDYLVKKGDLKSSSVIANGQTGIRLDGSFDKNIRGSAVIFKIRDKTLTVRTDANTFKADFDAIVASLKFNQ